VDVRRAIRERALGSSWPVDSRSRRFIRREDLSLAAGWANHSAAPPSDCRGLRNRNGPQAFPTCPGGSAGRLQTPVGCRAEPRDWLVGGELVCWYGACSRARGRRNNSSTRNTAMVSRSVKNQFNPKKSVACVRVCCRVRRGREEVPLWWADCGMVTSPFPWRVPEISHNLPLPLDPPSPLPPLSHSPP
jgi:hypothetical protein